MADKKKENDEMTESDFNVFADRYRAKSRGIDLSGPNWRADLRRADAKAEEQQRIDEEQCRIDQQLNEAKAIEGEETKVRRHAEIQAEVDLEAERRLAEIRSSSAPEKIRWYRSDRDLAELFVELRQKGQIKAESFDGVFKLASQHFCKEDGTAFNAHSLYVNLKAKRDFTKEAPAPTVPKPTQR